GGTARLLQADLRFDVPAFDLVSRVDATEVGTVIDNLINNALAFHGKVAPWVEVSLRQSGPSQAEITVSDKGTGVPATMREAVFERSVGEHRDTDDGSGLGLSLARNLARANGGDLDLAETRQGFASSFVLRLPALARAP